MSEFVVFRLQRFETDDDVYEEILEQSIFIAKKFFFFFQIFTKSDLLVKLRDIFYLIQLNKCNNRQAIQSVYICFN